MDRGGWLVRGVYRHVIFVAPYNGGIAAGGWFADINDGGDGDEDGRRSRWC